jgi:hypothetical protein
MPGGMGTLERSELKHQIARDMAIIEMFGGATRVAAMTATKQIVPILL